MLKTCCRCGAEFSASSAERVCTGCRKPPNVKPELSRRLTPRERQIISLVQQALLNKQIAYELHLSEGSIKEHLNRIYRKLEMHNGKTELAVWATLHPEQVSQTGAAA